MGSQYEFNDTLKLERGAEFPEPLRVGDRHEFSIAGLRVFHLSPIRVFLVEEIDGRWNFRGRCRILTQTMDASTQRTSGVFEVERVYTDDVRVVLNRVEAPDGKSFVDSRIE